MAKAEAVQMPNSSPSELDIFINILEQQRNNAMTELARAAARISVLEAALAESRAEQEKTE